MPTLILDVAGIGYNRTFALVPPSLLYPVSTVYLFHYSTQVASFFKVSLSLSHTTFLKKLYSDGPLLRFDYF